MEPRMTDPSREDTVYHWVIFVLLLVGFDLIGFHPEQRINRLWTVVIVDHVVDHVVDHE